MFRWTVNAVVKTDVNKKQQRKKELTAYSCHSWIWTIYESFATKKLEKAFKLGSTKNEHSIWRKWHRPKLLFTSMRKWINCYNVAVVTVRWMIRFLQPTILWFSNHSCGSVYIVTMMKASATNRKLHLLLLQCLECLTWQCLKSMCLILLFCSNRVRCNIPNCNQDFETLFAYENHYNSLHRFLCAQCSKNLPSAHLLDLHLSERHDSFFAVQSERKPMVSGSCITENSTFFL